MALSKIKSSSIDDGTILDVDINASAAIGASKLAGTLNLSSKTVTLPAASVTTHVDTAQLEMNVAMLAFKVATADSLAKFSMVDQVIDEFINGTGIDVATNGILLSGYYHSSVAGSTTDTTSWTHVGYDASGAGWTNYSLRQRLKSSWFTHTGTSTHMRLTIQTPATQTATLDYVFIGEWVTGGTGVNMTATPTIIQFGGANTWTIPANQNWVSDWTAFPVDTSKDYVVGIDFSSAAEQVLVKDADGIDQDYAQYVSGDTYNTATATGTQNFTNINGIRVIETRVVAPTTYNPLTLQSVATTAELDEDDNPPTTGDLVILITDNGGTPAIVNTDIKAKISRNGSVFTDYVTLVDEGDWGTNKRILVARNVDLSGITEGTAMKYKIETINQAAGKYTYIDAVSLAWA